MGVYFRVYNLPRLYRIKPITSKLCFLMKKIKLIYNIISGPQRTVHNKKQEAVHDPFKEPQNGNYWLKLNFLKDDNIWKLRLCFIPIVTCSVLPVSMLSVSSLLHDVFFTAWEQFTQWCGIRGILGHGSIWWWLRRDPPHDCKALWVYGNTQ